MKNAKPEQPAQPQQSADNLRAPLSPQEADIGRLDPFVPQPDRQVFPDWASI